MYPSGAWRGHWEQTIWGRQAMRDLVLRFEGGMVEGSGVDVVGRFTFAGTYDDGGNVALLKRYVGKHEVLYLGRYDGEGSIVGTWSIRELWSGPFALSPADFRVPSDAPILTISAPAPRHDEQR
jgi:hypothetical protein